ncbi:DUF356 domain-containing protein [Methanolobus mangrovi]|uniref:DUF356 domain-containing protein n=1 Tax=Methanolobus mangrovi TaxID=3072977 RepID=A0AA51UFF0_9EURY|nr:DUF356 domain-containing protein [Methanolobus mangrovi]WMW22191.1 DUF356 domain-containing protein [Methanolobus mangrovi]
MGIDVKSFAVIRGDNADKVNVALHDLEHYGRMKFLSKPKRIEPLYADNLLVSVAGVPLRAKCNSAALVELDNNAGAAISKLRKIHPPAHVVIVSPRHEVYEELMDKSELYPEFERNFEPQHH